MFGGDIHPWDDRDIFLILHFDCDTIKSDVDGPVHIINKASKGQKDAPR